MVQARGESSVGAIAVVLLVAFVSLVPAARAVTIDTSARTASAAKISMGWSTTATPEQVDSARWTDGNSNQTANLVSSGGSGGCGSVTGPSEFWGQSLGSMSGGGSIDPILVLQGNVGTWSAPRANRVAIQSSFPTSCSSYTAAVPVGTTYTFFDDPAYENELRVVRTYGFDVASPPFTQSDGLRAYVPRLPLGTYPTVVYPKTDQTLGSIDANSCASPCFPADFDQSAGWFAMKSAAGAGLIVRRDPGDSTSAKLEVDNDSTSASNLSDFDLLNPGGGTTSGFLGAVTETEYLCFFDATTWTSANQSSLTLPSGCGPVPVPSNSTPPSAPAAQTTGVTTSADPGTWTNSPTGYGYQWIRCDADGVSNCADIAQATNRAYTPVTADVGKTLAVRVVATNESGDSTAVTSAATQVVGTPPAQATVPSSNLLRNPGAEDGSCANASSPAESIPGWTTTNGFTVLCYTSGVTLDPSTTTAVGGGSAYFMGGVNDGAAAWQDVDVSAAAAQIDAGGVAASLSGLLGGYASQNDAMTVTATFLSAAQQVLGSPLQIGPVLAADRNDASTLVSRDATATLPSGTRTIRVTLTATRTEGSDNDAAADNLDLHLTTAAATPTFNGVNFTPQPSSAVLTGSVNLNGSQMTACHLDWGPDTSYGQSTGCGTSTPGSTGLVQVTAFVQGLAPGPSYHGRFAVTNAVGTTESGDFTFHSSDPPPVDAGASWIAIDHPTLPADGATAGTVKVTLLSSVPQPVAGKKVVLTASSGNSVVTPISDTTDANGSATFAVTDTSVEDVTYTASDPADGVTVAQTLTVHFSDPLHPVDFDPPVVSVASNQPASETYSPTSYPNEQILLPPEDSGTTYGRVTYALAGTWAPAPTGYRYQWLHCDTMAASSPCTDIAGATSHSFVPRLSDVDHALRVRVAATIGANSAAPVTSAPMYVWHHSLAGTRPATATTAAASGHSTTATLGGLVIPGQSQMRSFGFRWGRSTLNHDTGIVRTIAFDPTKIDASTPVAADISGLTPGLTYRYQLYAEGGFNAVATGAIRTFTAGVSNDWVNAPIITDAQFDDATTPRLDISIIPGGAPTTVSIAWSGPDVQTGSSLPTLYLGTSPATLATEPAPLPFDPQPGLAYSYTISASNKAGTTTYKGVLGRPWTNTVVTYYPSNITTRSADLSGTFSRSIWPCPCIYHSRFLVSKGSASFPNFTGDVANLTGDLGDPVATQADATNHATVTGLAAATTYYVEIDDSVFTADLQHVIDAPGQALHFTTPAEAITSATLSSGGALLSTQLGCATSTGCTGTYTIMPTSTATTPLVYAARKRHAKPARPVPGVLAAGAFKLRGRSHTTLRIKLTAGGRRWIRRHRTARTLTVLIHDRASPRGSVSPVRIALRR